MVLDQAVSVVLNQVGIVRESNLFRATGKGSSKGRKGARSRIGKFDPVRSFGYAKGINPTSVPSSRRRPVGIAFDGFVLLRGDGFPACPRGPRRC